MNPTRLVYCNILPSQALLRESHGLCSLVVVHLWRTTDFINKSQTLRCPVHSPTVIISVFPDAGLPIISFLAMWLQSYFKQEKVWLSELQLSQTAYSVMLSCTELCVLNEYKSKMHEMAKAMDTATWHQASSTVARFCRFGTVNGASQTFTDIQI
jgi:hypothetical protein